MKTLLFLLIASFFSTTSFAGFVSCKSTDGELKLSLKSVQSEIVAVKFFHPIDLRLINESLPAGIYANIQDINEHINWYFEDEAYISITHASDPTKARIQIIGEGNQASRLVIFSKSITCDAALI